MALLDDILNPGVTMLGPQGVKGTAALASQPQPKKKVQNTPQAPPGAKPAPPVDLSDNPFAAGADTSDNPFADASGPDAKVQQLHAEYAAGHLAQQEAAKSAVDPERRSADITGSPLDAALTSAVQGGETALSGIPGASMALAGLRHLRTGESYHDAQAEQANEIGGYEKANPMTSRVMQTLAAAPLAARFLPGGLVKGGATYAALANALDPNLDESLAARAGHTVGGAGEGAVLGKLLGSAGQSVQKLGAATGITDALSNILAKAGDSPFGQAAQDLAAHLGTRGAVNSSAADREALRGIVGGEESPADLLSRRVAEGRAEAKPLYDAAKVQANTLEGAPAAARARLDELLANADQKALPAPGQSEIERQAAQKGLAGHDYTQGPAPTLEQAAAHDYTATTPPTEPFRDNGLLQQDFTRERPVQLRAANDVNVRQEGTPEVTPTAENAPDQFQAAQDATGRALANPHVQMQIKSLMGDAPSLGDQPVDSYDVLRKVQANMNAEYGKMKATGQDSGPYWHELNGARADVNRALLAKAPALAEANATFAREVGTPREGITKGATAGVNPTGKAALTRSPDAIQQWIASAPDATQRAARAAAVSAGVGARMGQTLAGVPLDEGTAGALKIPAFSGSEAGANMRALLTPERRSALDAVLSNMGTRSAQEAQAMTPRGMIESLYKGPAQYNYPAQPRAVGPLRDAATAMQDGSLDLAPFQRGGKMIDKLRDAIRAITVARTGQMASP